MSEQHAKVGIGVFAIRNGKFLMGKRINAHGDNTWSVPGGHLEYKESFEDTAKRELLEETGLEIKNVCFGAVTNDYFPVEDKHYVTVWVTGECPDGEPVIAEPDKFIEMGWFDLDTLPEPLFLPWNQLLGSQFVDGIRKVIESK